MNDIAESQPSPRAEVGAEHEHPPTDANPQLDWQAELARRWDALVREVFGQEDGTRRKLRDLVDDCALLIVVTAWFASHGNITHAAKRLGASRRALRERIVVWRKDHPDLVPRPPVRQLKSNKPRRRKRRPATEDGAA